MDFSIEHVPTHRYLHFCIDYREHQTLRDALVLCNTVHGWLLPDILIHLTGTPDSKDSQVVDGSCDCIRCRPDKYLLSNYSQFLYNSEDSEEDILEQIAEWIPRGWGVMTFWI